MKEKAINELVREVRIDSGLKQKDSRKNVMGAAAYSRIENGKKELTVNELIGVLGNLQISYLNLFLLTLNQEFLKV